MTALVTGATGFVGSAVARKLIGAGKAVRVLVRADSDRRNIDGLRVEALEGELGDRASLARALEGCDALYHVAADYRLWVPDPDRMYANNVEGTRNIMEAALDAGVGRIVYTSSVAVLGLHPDGTPADEDLPVSVDDMIGHYKRSKFLAEEEVRRMVSEQGLPAVIVNPSTPIGPRDIKPTPTGRMIVEAAAGRMPAYVDTGLNLVHVDDVALGHLLAFERGRVGERYILGAENLSLREILTEIAGMVGRRPPRIRLPHNLLL
ncbi:MAG: NAD-dependent epimerase/dehydratase family protein, partial [Proteobacteria bacterium]|nr:NAD-dependent epimerase/dehydratase family protein [Pseudomonadota bacterium]